VANCSARGMPRSLRQETCDHALVAWPLQASTHTHARGHCQSQRGQHGQQCSPCAHITSPHPHCCLDVGSDRVDSYPHDSDPIDSDAIFRSVSARFPSCTLLQPPVAATTSAAGKQCACHASPKDPCFATMLAIAQKMGDHAENRGLRRHYVPHTGRSPARQEYWC